MADFTVTMTNPNATRDADAARFAVERENERRVSANQDAGLSDGDAGYLAELPTGNNAQLLASYQITLAYLVSVQHLKLQEIAAKQLERESDVRALWANATQAQRTAAISALQA